MSPHLPPVRSQRGDAVQDARGVAVGGWRLPRGTGEEQVREGTGSGRVAGDGVPAGPPAMGNGNRIPPVGSLPVAALQLRVPRG